MHRERWVILDKDPERRFNSEWASPIAPIMELVDMPASKAGADLALQVRVLLGAFFVQRLDEKTGRWTNFVLTAFDL